MQGAIVALATAVALVAVPANASDPQGTDIIGLRLGMTTSEVVTALGRQGFKATVDRNAVTARTRDGDLSIELADSRIKEIRYIFRGHSAGEADTIEASIADRLGPPDRAVPTTWCQTNGPNGTCTPRGASLTFVPETLTLILRAGVGQDF